MSDVFKRSLDEVYALKDQGLIEGIVLSTWKGELLKYSGLLQTLSDVCIIESVEPPSSKGNILAQQLSLKAAIDCLPSNVWVFKTRCDVVISRQFLSKVITSQDEYKISGEIEIPVLTNKIWIPWYEKTKPFYLADECFFGNARDIKKTINLNDGFDERYCMDHGLTHIRRFANPFISRYPIIHKIMNWFGYSGHDTANRYILLKAALSLNHYRVSLFFYYTILRAYFHVESEDTKVLLYRSSDVYSKHSIKKECSNGTISESFNERYSWNTLGHLYGYDNNWVKNALEELKKDSVLSLYDYNNLEKLNDLEFSTDELNHYHMKVAEIKRSA